MPYAEKTQVPVSKTKSDLSTLVKKYGASGVAVIEDGEAAIFGFKLESRVVQFRMVVPEGAQAERAMWRALLLTVKAKLESRARGIETFDEAFLAQIVLPDNRRVGEVVRPRLEDHYHDRGSPPLLPGPV